MAAFNRNKNQSRNMRFRGNNSNNNSSNSQIYKELHGQKFLPTEMPPSFVAQPWNNINLILRLYETPPISVKVSSIRTALQAQSGFTNVPNTKDEKTNVHYDLRFKSFSVWAVDSQPMSMFPMDLLNNHAELCRIDSNPQKNMYARAGYKLPLAQSSVTFSTLNQASVALLILQNAVKYEVHINLLWKGADTSLPTLTYVYQTDKRRRKHKGVRAKLVKLLESCDLSSDEEDDSDDVKSINSLPSSIQLVN